MKTKETVKPNPQQVLKDLINKQIAEEINRFRKNPDVAKILKSIKSGRRYPNGKAI
jgi:hypothetical protein